MKMTMTKTIPWLLAVTALTVAVPMFASADPGDRGGRGNWGDRGNWHGDIRRFNDHDLDRWRGGNWHHDYHDGRLGWWWVVGGLWYFYPQWVQGYPDPYTPPPVVVIQQAPPPAPQPPPSQYWYFCDAANAYYPYVPTCPGPWRMVPASPPGQ